jgi:hypothetical protein
MASPKWSVDLQPEHERYLTEKYAKKPVVVMNYPKAIRRPALRGVLNQVPSRQPRSPNLASCR